MYYNKELLILNQYDVTVTLGSLCIIILTISFLNAAEKQVRFELKLPIHDVPIEDGCIYPPSKFKIYNMTDRGHSGTRLASPNENKPVDSCL